MHELIRLMAFYGSIFTVSSALVFISYLTVYDLITKSYLNYNDQLSLRNIVPWLSLISGTFSLFITLTSVLALIAGA